ncbi:MAG: valine--tRNA ligase [Candidatus Woesearchaeota archaeon]
MEKSYDAAKVEARLTQEWHDEGIYAFNPEEGKEIYAIDTPPPTISGAMHLGHAFSYTQMDFIARYNRMRGKVLFYPFGTDDNGIATEIFVEKLKKVKAANMDRKEFTKLCLETLEEIRPRMVQDWKNIGLSCDFSLFYSTINDHCQKISQRSFIDLYKKGRQYRKDAPVLWCPHCKTAISQVECEDNELQSTFNDLIFTSNGDELIIGTTRPEYLPACVALFYHPDDDRYQHLQGRKAKVPLFEHEVPIIADERADPEKGTGLVMCCTFGDQTDIEWYFAHELPLRSLITKDGKLKPIAGKYQGLSVHEARLQVIEDLQKEGLLVNQKGITHTVNVHERCGKEIEIIHSKQWFIRYLDIKDKLLKWGEELNWYPEHMKVRYDNWVKGLQWDWLISRQRYSGIPIPVWYCDKCEEVILPEEDSLPVDPLSDPAPVDTCPKCGNDSITPEKDVFDTWATSSLTPQIAAELVDPELQKQIYPMDLRAQAHDIITFWLFNTVVKSQLHNRVNPWKDVVISGHALDPHSKKMSKSKGNVVAPQDMIEKYSADALRYWAASSRLGDDLPFQEKDLVTGKKTTVKLWNASRFVFMHLEDFTPEEVPLEIMDRWLITKLHRCIQVCTNAFEGYEYSRAKFQVDNFFWKTFCDNYLEVCKDRLYNPEERGHEARRSAQLTLHEGLLTTLKLFAPIMPYITDEVYRQKWSGSIHNSLWPEYDETKIDEHAEKVGDILINIVEEVRRAKSDSNVSLKTPIKRLSVRAKMTQLDLNEVEDELKAITKAQKVDFVPLPEESEEDFECVVDLEQN